ncbi:MAG: hypothetical protein OFPII_25030 [Osedax symbiont Rs1]|nr:MAG: hypothetical protein OFPII_25030 [Osedax symbiont Rs1]
MFIERSCIFCDLPSDNHLDVCSHCLQDLPWQGNACSKCALPLSIVMETTTIKQALCKNCIELPPFFQQTFATFNYNFPIDALIPKIKSEKQRFHLHWLALCLTEKLPACLKMPEVLIPVPISKKKMLRTGYNQTEQLASELSKLLNIEVDNRLVSKNRDTRAQANLNAKQRKRNLLDAFEVQENNYRHIAIIDDVMTTGATVNEIAKHLLITGICKVDVWVLARTPL